MELHGTVTILLHVFSGGSAATHNLSSLFGLQGTLALKSQWGDKALDLGGLATDGSVLLSDITADDELADIIILGKVEELADLGGTLGAQSSWDGDVGQSWDWGWATFDDDQGED